jgi:hypothetical protein
VPVRFCSVFKELQQRSQSALGNGGRPHWNNSHARDEAIVVAKAFIVDTTSVNPRPHPTICRRHVTSLASTNHVSSWKLVSQNGADLTKFTPNFFHGSKLFILKCLSSCHLRHEREQQSNKNANCEQEKRRQHKRQIRTINFKFVLDESIFFNCDPKISTKTVKVGFANRDFGFRNVLK